jgi:hypothetical protein
MRNPFAIKKSPEAQPRDRRMTRAELLGSHSHGTLCGPRVHVWRRAGRYLARGRHEGRPFGENLGADPVAAAAHLRQLLTAIEDGSYVRPSEARKRPLGSGRVRRLTLRQLVNEFLAEKRKGRGLQTAGDYKSRLLPVLAFAEQAPNRKRWPLALDIDGDFAASLRSFLFQYRTSRNGRPGGKPKPLSERQVVNVLECLRTMLGWARSSTPPACLPRGRAL